MEPSHESLRATLTAAGFADVADDMIAASKPGVQIIRSGDHTDGFSKLGGRPDVAPGFAWPHREPTRRLMGLAKSDARPLAFLAQIDLAAAAAHDATGQLPTTGRLWLFYDTLEYPWGFDPKDRDGWKVVFVPGAGPTTPTEAPRGAYGKGADDKPFDERRIAFRATVTYPDRRYFDVAEDRYYPLWEAMDQVEKMHDAGVASAGRILGHPALVQNPMELECQLASNGLYVGGSKPVDERRAQELAPGAADWILLVQLESDDVWMWGDAGTLYFWIRKQDLAARDFSKVWVILQCS